MDQLSGLDTGSLTSLFNKPDTGGMSDYMSIAKLLAGHPSYSDQGQFIWDRLNSIDNTWQNLAPPLASVDPYVNMAPAQNSFMNTLFTQPPRYTQII